MSNVAIAAAKEMLATALERMGLALLGPWSTSGDWLFNGVEGLSAHACMPVVVSVGISAAGVISFDGNPWSPDKSRANDNIETVSQSLAAVLKTGCVDVDAILPDQILAMTEDDAIAAIRARFSPDAITDLVERLSLVAQHRMNSGEPARNHTGCNYLVAYSGSPSAFCWLSPKEDKSRHLLQQSLPTEGELQQAARDRITQRIAARKAANGSSFAG